MFVRTVPARQGSQWIADAWALFKKQPAVWIALGAIDLVVTLVLDLIPFTSDLTALFTVLWAGGMVAAAEHMQATGSLRVTDAIDGIRKHWQPLFAAGVFALLVQIVCDVLGQRVPGGLAMFAKAPTDYTIDSFSWLALLLYLALAVGASMALWLAPALIVTNGASPIDALKASFTAACRNIWPTLVYGLFVTGLIIAAVLTLGIGLLVAGPLLYLSTYAACRELVMHGR